MPSGRAGCLRATPTAPARSPREIVLAGASKFCRRSQRGARDVPTRESVVPGMGVAV
jgi:hypothetical protein